MMKPENTECKRLKSNDMKERIFRGANLLQSSFTKFCPLERILTAFGVKEQSDRKPGNKSRSGMQGCCPVE